MSAVLEAREPIPRYLKVASPALVRHFELLATAPGGVARLREFILSLAVQGKLTAQDCDEKPASALLKRIQDRKLRSIAPGAIKQGKQPPALQDAEPMFELPKGWTWTRLGELCSYIQRGKGPTYAEQSEHKVISQKCVRWYGLDLTPARFVTPESLAKYEPVRFLRAGDLLWNSTGTGTIGRACVVPIELDDAGLVADSHVTVVRPLEVSSVFLWRWIQSPFVQNEIEGSASGTTNQIELNTSTVVNQPVPLPSPAEQVRIVARVDELMRLCDVLDAKGRLEAEQHARLLGTLLGTLTDSSTPEVLAGNWRSVADHFDLLLDRPEAVDALEQTILQLAVRGLLVPQSASVDTSTLALEEAGAEQIPPHWTRSRFGDVVSMLNGYAFRSEWFQASGTRLVRNVNVGHGHLEWHEAAHVSAEVAQQLSKFALAEGDVVLTLDRPIISTGLKHALIRKGDLPCLLLQRVARLSPAPAVLSADFMLLWLRSDSFVKAIDPGRSNGVPHISTKQVAALTIDLPPLEEQARIVARVAELRHLCVDLRNRLERGSTVQTALAVALIDHALAS